MKKIVNRDNLTLLWLLSALVSLIPAFWLSSDQMATVNPIYRILSIPFYLLFASPFMVVIYWDVKEKFTGYPKPKESETE